MQGFACKGKTAELTKQAFERFLGPQTKAQHVYTDGSKEFLKALAELCVSHDTSTPYRPQTNGVAERAVRRVKEGASCTLVQSGWNNEWWADAMACYCFLRNVVDFCVHAGSHVPVATAKAAYEHRFGEPFQSPIIPFGAEVLYLPITDKQKSPLP